jgi:hypothetical protein
MPLEAAKIVILAIVPLSESLGLPTNSDVHTEAAIQVCWWSFLQH